MCPRDTATSPISKSAPLSNAAKNDVLGANGTYTFSIADLLANDAGGANKIGTGQFFFGSGLDQLNQPKYMADHGIFDNGDGTYTLLGNAIDFQYSVQIGNKGTWSTADVDVTAPPPEAPPVDTHHNGNLAAEWTFENHTAGAGDEIGYAPTGFWNMDQWAASHSADYLEADNAFAFASNMQVHGEQGHRALDTAASPGNIFLQAIVPGYEGASMPDLVAGQEYHAEVKVLKQDYSHVPGMIEAGTEGTDPDAWVSFKFNDKVLEVYATDTAFDDHANEYLTFDVTFKGVEGQDSFFIMSHGTGDDYQGLLIDQIQIHDWIVA